VHFNFLSTGVDCGTLSHGMTFARYSSHHNSLIASRQCVRLRIDQLRHRREQLIHAMAMTANRHGTHVAIYALLDV